MCTVWKSFQIIPHLTSLSRFFFVCCCCLLSDLCCSLFFFIAKGYTAWCWFDSTLALAFSQLQQRERREKSVEFIYFIRNILRSISTLLLLLPNSGSTIASHFFFTLPNIVEHTRSDVLTSCCCSLEFPKLLVESRTRESVRARAKLTPMLWKIDVEFFMTNFPFKLRHVRRTNNNARLE